MDQTDVELAKILSQFAKIVDQLVIWKDMPRGKDRGVLVRALYDWCDGHIERAQWLLKQRDDFAAYPGPSVLKQMIKNQFEPAGPYAPYQLEKRPGDYGLPPLNHFPEPNRKTPDPEARNPVVLPACKCKSCSDSGMVLSTGLYCTCELGQKLQARSVSETISFAATGNAGAKEPDRIKDILRNLTYGYGGKGGDDV